ncbi:MAG: DEAD/DEAH box helicase, partial [Aeromonas veronii]
VFGPNVQAATEIADACNQKELKSEVVTGTTSTTDRAEFYGAFEAGAIQVISSCSVLTEGWDAPWASCAVIARPTTSIGLYTQMIGRVMRPWPGKHDALVIDMMSGNNPGSIITLPDLSTREEIDSQTTDPVVGNVMTLLDIQDNQQVEGILTYRDLILLAESESLWQTTTTGVLFLPLQDGLIFLWHGRGGDWQVWTRSFRGGASRALLKGANYVSAVAYAEDAATRDGQVVNRFGGRYRIDSRAATWRRGKPTPTQVEYATSLGISVDGLRKGAVADAISRHKAERLLPRKDQSETRKYNTQ